MSPIAEPQTFPQKIGEIEVECPKCHETLIVELYGIKTYTRKRPRNIPSHWVHVSVKET